MASQPSGNLPKIMILSVWLPIMVGSDHGIFIVRRLARHLQVLMQATLGILQRPVAMEISREVNVFLLQHNYSDQTCLHS